MSVKRYRNVAHYIYRYYDKSGVLLYVGVTNDPARRRAQHDEEKPWACEISDTKLTPYSNPFSAFNKERYAILCEKPKHNKLK